MFGFLGVRADVTTSLVLGSSMTGLDQSGSTSIYTIALGYGDETGSPTWLALSSVSYSALTDQTLSGLLTATYNNLEAQLSSQLQIYLTVDLADNALNFTVPASVIPDPSVAGFSTDTSLSYDIEMTAGANDPNASFSPPGLKVDNKNAITVTVTVAGVAYTGTTGSSPTLTDVQNLCNAVDDNGNATQGLYNAATKTTLTGINAAQVAGEIQITVPKDTTIEYTGGKQVIADAGTLGNQWPNASFTMGLVPVPEPSTFALLGIGAVSLLSREWRRRTAKA